MLVWCMRLVQKTDAEIQEARAKAARDLTNIDEPERKRRVAFGSVLLVRRPAACLLTPAVPFTEQEKALSTGDPIGSIGSVWYSYLLARPFVGVPGCHHSRLQQGPGTAQGSLWRSLWQAVGVPRLHRSHWCLDMWPSSSLYEIAWSIPRSVLNLLVACTSGRGVF